ncbi:serine/threonine-protein kinase S6KL [Achroia grisella]|uniref:serine/threonine-protein kinase S6KL n=1 Tax=Achroia grisella TaxID=688607 RepID=UPI0027D2077D|nr:serine/threonine-protein kinase S6KL [Achroia grisella]
MGNSHNKSNNYRNFKQSSTSDRDRQAYNSQFSLSHFVGNLSGRSYQSVTSNQSVYSASRPWSRVSRRRWNETTLKNPLEASKTAWPVAHKESIFLPEFPITTDLLQRDYIIEETIAKGAFGQVYRVKKVSEDKDYALKVLSKAQIVNQNAIRQVKEEARIQTACGHHSFIAGAVSRWQTKKRLYIVSEYIPGGELLALLDKYGKIPEELVKIFVAEIAIALDFLHNAGVIYRDLKPENILLDSDYHVQLIDFGLSKWLSIGSRTTTLCGTLKYMAPEVLGREPYGHAVDWWSLGVIICRMLINEVEM